MSTPKLLAAALLASALPTLAHAIGRHDARNGDECREQVNANYEALVREMAAHGNYHGIASTDRRWRQPKLRECEQMDRTAREARMAKAHARLTAAIETLRSGGSVGDAEVRWLAEEQAAIAQFPEAPYRTAFLQLHQDFLRYVSAPPPIARCGEVLGALRAARHKHDDAVAALVAGRSAPADPADRTWRVHEQQRQAALAEIQWNRFLGVRAGCLER